MPLQTSGVGAGVSRKRREAILNLYTLALCVLLIASPWWFGFERQIAKVDAWLVGALIIAISIASLIRFAEWEEWVILILALWLLTSPWLLGFAHAPAKRIDVAIGALVAYVTAIVLWLIHYMPTFSWEAP